MVLIALFFGCAGIVAIRLYNKGKERIAWEEEKRLIEERKSREGSKEKARTHRLREDNRLRALNSDIDWSEKQIKDLEEKIKQEESELAKLSIDERMLYKGYRWIDGQGYVSISETSPMDELKKMKKDLIDIKKNLESLKR